MKLAHLNLAGQRTWPDLRVDRLGPELNVFYAPAKGGKSTVVRLIESLLADLRPELATRLWKVDFSESLQPGELLTEEFLRRLLDRRKSLSIESASSKVDRRRIEELDAETRQLAHLQTQLRERLQQLLARRKSREQPPRADTHLSELDTAEPLQAMQQERDELTRRLETLRREVDHFESRWSHIQHQRAGLLGGASLGALHDELKRLESILHRSLQASEPSPTKARHEPPLASDLLAELSDGQLMQIHFEMRRHFLTVVDRQGNVLAIDALTAGQRDQLYLALTLTLVRSYAHNGVKRPLILDEPFRHQDAESAVRMARVLEQFAQAGHQVLVFAEDRTAWRCFSPSATVFELEELRTPANTQPITPSIETTIHSRVIRKVTGSQPASALRMTAIEGDRNTDDVFYLSEASSIEEFPILGAETKARFKPIGIQTIGELLAADVAVVARQLQRDEIDEFTVALWQKHMRLMCQVPNVTLDDAQLITAVGIESPTELADADLNTLRRSVESFLTSHAGQRFASSRSRYHRSRIGDWRRGARRYRDRCENGSPKILALGAA